MKKFVSTGIQKGDDPALIAITFRSLSCILSSFVPHVSNTMIGGFCYETGSSGGRHVWMMRQTGIQVQCTASDQNHIFERVPFMIHIAGMISAKKANSYNPIYYSEWCDWWGHNPCVYCYRWTKDEFMGAIMYSE